MYQEQIVNGEERVVRVKNLGNGNRYVADNNARMEAMEREVELLKEQRRVRERGKERDGEQCHEGSLGVQFDSTDRPLLKAVAGLEIHGTTEDIVMLE
jgi:hypothetical protein